MALADVETVDFEPEDDDLMDEEGGTIDVDTSPRRPLHQKLRSAITADASKKTKGRGFHDETAAERNAHLSARDFDSIDTDAGTAAQRSIEGWIILVTGVHEEAQEDDLQNAFGEFGQIRNLHLNLDRRTGFVKGYALIEYEDFEEAQAAVNTMNGTELLTQTISVDWAFSSGPYKKKNMRRRSPRRSRSPKRRY